MCAITGRLNFDRARPIDPECLAAMTSAVRHRGPDADGYYVGGGVGLGHRRLSILDLATGDQPLSNEDGEMWVVFNGEIYNFAAIRTQLEAFGHRFRTNTDTEVIVHAHEEWGDAAVARFRGMFAYALWDNRQHRLLLVRDRLGIKPLYYAVTNTGVVFGSEIKSILEDPEVNRDWSPEAVDAYLALLYVPAPQTIYESIRKLPPGHMLAVENGRASVRRYWDLVFTGDGHVAHEDEYLERLDALVTEAVRLRLVSDVPLGAFLSGGIDSSLVVAAMARTSASPVVTTSVGFNERAYNELEYARTVARHLGVEAHESVVRPELCDLLPTLAWHFDEPFGDSSAVPTYCVSAAARQRVTVALSGDGGDELWAGYARHRVEHWEMKARRWLGPSTARRVGTLAGRLSAGFKGARSLQHLAWPAAEAYARKHAYGLFEADDRRGVYTGDFASSVAGSDPFESIRVAYDSCSSTDPLDRALYVDVKTYLVDDILTKVDKMSMAVALEARVPLLDHKLIEFVATIPSCLKLRNGRGKHLLRKLLGRYVPMSIVDRPKKGFSVPVGDWLRGPLAPMVDDLLLSGRMRSRGVFEHAGVERMWREHRTSVRNHEHRLWNLVMLELWFRQFADRPATSVGAAA